MQLCFTKCEVYCPLLLYIPSHAGIPAESQLNSIQPVSDTDGKEGYFIPI